MTEVRVKPHHYLVRTTWSGASEGATVSYPAYSREWTVEVPGKEPLRGSADRIFHGDASLYNPEDLLVVALSTCHLLSYLALCARESIPVVGYVDEARGTMTLDGGKMRFTEVLLQPRVTLASGDVRRALELHGTAHEECFIASSVNFPVRHEAVVEVLTSNT